MPLNLSIRIIMKKKNLMFKDVAPGVVTIQTLNRLMKGDNAITPGTIGKVARILGASDYLEYLYRLDQLYLSDPARTTMPFFQISAAVPTDIQRAIVAFHPLFNGVAEK